MNIRLSEQKKNGILWISAAFFFAVYLSLCFNDNVWTDEAFTIELLRENFGGIVLGTAADVHPPLYYLIAKCFTLVFGSSLVTLKIVSILPMILCMTWGAFRIRKLFGLRTALLFNVLLAVIPCTMEYAVQPRMYSWAIFFITFMGLWAYEACMEGRTACFAGVMLTSVAAAYTHYFAFVSAILIYGFLFLALVFTGQGKGLLKWLGSVVLSLILYLPWLPYMELQVKGVSRSYWIEEITGDTIREFFPFLFDMGIPFTTTVWMVLLIICVVVSVYMMTHAQDRAAGIYALLLLLVPVGTAVTGVVASSLIRPIFIVRYLLPCMGLVALALAITLGRYVPKQVYLAGLFFFLCAGIVDYGQSVYREYQWTHTAETEQFLTEHVKENDIIAYNYESYDFVYDYYWSDEEKVLWQDIDLDTASYDTIWLLDTIYWPYPTDEYLAEHGWKRQFMGNYGIEHNDFKIWAITRQ